MRIRSIKYYIREGFSNLIKNRLMSVASIMVVAVCIFMVTVSYSISRNIDYILEQIENSIGISAFAQDNLETSKLPEIMKSIEAIDHVVNVKYISPAEGLEKMKEDFGEDGNILDGYIDDNPLSASFEITVDQAEYQKEVVQKLEGLSGIRKVRHALSITDILINASKVIHIISIVLIAVLCIISLVIIVNTIKLAVYIRRTEINIMKYVGATDWFIRWPFVIEGTLIGIIGSIIPISICILSYGSIIDKIYVKFPIIKQLVEFKPFGEIFPVIVPIAIVVGIIIGTFGSLFSVHKHLQV